MVIQGPEVPALRKTYLKLMISFLDSSSFATLTVRNCASLLSEIYDITDSIVQPINKTSSLVYSTVAIQPIPPVFTTPGCGKNSLGYGHNPGPLINILIGFSWLDAREDAKFKAASKAFIKRSQDVARERHLLYHVQYLNYAAEWQDPIAGYGSAEKKRLQKASKKYDPTGIFQKAVPGGFKLF